MNTKLPEIKKLENLGNYKKGNLKKKNPNGYPEGSFLGDFLGLNF